MAEQANPLSVLEKSLGEAVAFAAGIAIGPLLAPYVQELKNTTWQGNPSLPLDPADVAEWVAEDAQRLSAGIAEAALTGVAKTPFERLYDTKLTAPGVGELLALLRRAAEVNIDFEHGLRKGKLETQWDAALKNLQWVRISAPDLAYMVVRGIVPDMGTLPGALPTEADHLKLPPQYALDTIAEAHKTGWDKDRFAALVARSGLAMAPVMAAQANFRGILTDNDYLLTIARGDLYPAYADPVKEVSRQILTASQYAELQLRGYLNRDQRIAGTAKHGMTTVDSDHLFDVLGRSIPVHQITTGLARGGQFGVQPDLPPPAYLQSLQRGNLRPEYYDLAYANRYTMPSAFVIRGLTQSGAWKEERAEQALLYSGWIPDWAKDTAQFWAQGTGTTADPHVAKAQTQLWTATHRSYLTGELADVDATTALVAAGVDANSVPEVLTLWAHEANVRRKPLTQSQTKALFKKAVTNPDTGLPYTKDEVIPLLVELGMRARDASEYLDA